MALKDKLRVGCSGWGYDDWLGGFYPPDTPKSDYLKLYSGVFDCVEVDSSFYRNPGPAMTKGWYKSTPPGFLFAMKMPKRITHEKKLKGVRKVRAARRAASAVHQVRLPLDRHAGVPSRARG